MQNTYKPKRILDSNKECREKSNDTIYYFSQFRKFLNNIMIF